ncbi:hypothetical protein ACFYZ9_25875 [Streptomyces sp. NPDC001691]|uniref:hypothetical protein n=1 Tax=unclassified Streptomyces TaxID=2593676 RepID=UPI000DE9F24D|nr:hypothetical protein [Streptomyces sp. SDr-06]RCH67447.1 hypothetical protein DT019_17710 [Streptomyces sp. SDr-06]
MTVIKRYSLRIAAVGVISAVSVGLMGTVASAATPAPSSAAAVKASVTAKPSATSVQAWQLFRVTGSATGLKAGSKLVLQQKQGAKWVSLPAVTTLNAKGTYSLGVKLGIKGKNDLRIVSGNTASPVFSVTVR